MSPQVGTLGQQCLAGVPLGIVGGRQGSCGEDGGFTGLLDGDEAVLALTISVPMTVGAVNPCGTVVR